MEKPLPQEHQGEDMEAEDSGEAHPADEAPASPRAKRSKPSGKVAASPKPKKTRDALPLPAPKRAKKPAPSQDKDAESAGALAEADLPAHDASPVSSTGARSPKRRKMPPSRQEEEEKEGEADLPADETAASSPALNPSGQVAASPRNKKKGLKRHNNCPPPQEQEATDAPANETAPSSFRKLSSQRKRRGDLSKRDKQASDGGEVEKVPAGDASLSQEEQCTQEEQAAEGGADKSTEALPEMNVSSPKRSGSKREKKPAVERLWSMEDELRILAALHGHAETHNGMLPDRGSLFTTLSSSFDRKDADAGNLDGKVRKLKVWYDKMCLQGCPNDDHGHQLFDLCALVWGSSALQNNSHCASISPRRNLRNTSNSNHVVPEGAHQDGGAGGKHASAPNGARAMDVGPSKDSSKLLVKDLIVGSGNFEDNGACLEEDNQVGAASSRREISVLSTLYPSLVEVVEEYTQTHSSRNLILGALERIGDNEAKDLDARCKKQRIDMFNMQICQAELIKVVLSTLGSLIN